MSDAAWWDNPPLHAYAADIVPYLNIDCSFPGYSYVQYGAVDRKQRGDEVRARWKELKLTCGQAGPTAMRAQRVPWQRSGKKQSRRGACLEDIFASSKYTL